MENFFLGMYYGLSRSYLCFPKLEFEADIDNDNKNKFMEKFIKLKRNEKEFKVEKFLIELLDKRINFNKESLENSLANFIKLKSNKNALKYVFKKYLKTILNINETENLSFDEFMKTNPDSELQSIFFLLSTFETGTTDFIENNILKIDKKAKIDVLKQIIRNRKFLGILKKKEINIDDFFINIFQKLSTNKQTYIKDVMAQLIGQRFSFKDIEKVLLNFEEEEIKSLFYIYIITLIKEGKLKGNIKDISSLNKRFQIDILTFFSIDIIYGGPAGTFFELFDFDVRLKFLEYLIISGKLEVIASLNSNDDFYNIFCFLFKTKEEREKAFKNISFEAQMKIIEHSPKEEKVYQFSLLSDKNRTRETLNSLRDIDRKSAEKYLFIEPKEKAIEKEKNESQLNNNNTNLGLSKEDFKNRLKFFNSSK